MKDVRWTPLKRRKDKIIMENCIICRNPILEKSLEHVFPEAIGGMYIINTVCKICNSLLGNSVDIKLINHICVSIFREEFQLPGKNGQIPCFFDQTVVINDDPLTKGRLQKDLDGSLVLKIITSTEYAILNDKEQAFYVSVDGSNTKDLEKIKAKIEERAHKQGKTVHFDNSLKRTTIHKPKISGIFPNIDINDFKIGFLKIAYEFACEMVPDYLTDSWSLDIAQILKKGLTTDLHKYVFGSGFDIEYISCFKLFGDFSNNHTIHLLDSDFGLVCYVSIFAQMYVLVRLSKKKYCGDERYFCYNDYVNKTYYLKKFSEYVFD